MRFHNPILNFKFAKGNNLKTAKGNNMKTAKGNTKKNNINFFKIFTR